MKIIFTLLLISIFTANQLYSQTNVSGSISSNTVWEKANSPYIVTDTVFVLPNVTLTIEPGVTVKFEPTKNMVINGTLTANGTMIDSITFTSNQPSPTIMDWNGLHLDTDAILSFNYCNMRYSSSAIFYLVNSYNVSFTIKNSLFEYNNQGFSRGGNNDVGGTIDSCIFRNNNIAIGPMGYGQQYITNSLFTSNTVGVSGYGNTTHILNCNFCDNTNEAIDLARKIKNCKITGSNIGINRPYELVENCIITGNNTGIMHDVYITVYTGNKICNNTNYDFKNNTSDNADISNNCWCSSDSSAIAGKIYDGNDNSNFGLITFTPFSICSPASIPDPANCFQLVTNLSTVNQKTSSSHIQIYPNPANMLTNIEVQNSTNEKYVLLVFNALGEVVFQKNNITTQTTTLERGKLAAGLYIVQIRSEKGIIATDKLILE